MRTIQVRGKTGADGVLHLSIPVDAPHAEFDIVVVVQQQPVTIDPSWPPGFFEETAGGIKDETFIRHPQGEYEKREEF